jgi:hypothetical protein
MSNILVDVTKLVETIAYLQDYVEGQKLDLEDETRIIELVEELTSLIR